MNKSALAIALTLCALPAAAQDLCVPNASGVPTQPGPPIWWTAGGGTDGQSIDDPRWLGAAGHSFDYGAAAIPYELRALAAPGTGAVANDFYFSHVISIDPNATVPHEVFIGIHRPGAHTAPDPSGYILEFHVNAGTGTAPIIPTFCAAPPCGATDWYAVWTDFGNTGQCTGAGGATGEQFVPISGLSTIVWIDQASRYFKLAAGGAPFTQDRWAVEIQMPQVSTGVAGTIDNGIEPGATVWYEAAQHVDATGNGLAMVGEWPNTASANGICIRTNSTPHALFHVDLMGATPAYANMTALEGGAAPTDCDTGLAIRTPDIGTVLNAPAGTNFATYHLTDTEVHASGVNTMVAQVENTGATDITTPLLGRFRLASWGATAGLSAPGAWIDIRGATGGVCSQGTAPTCTSDDIPANGKTSIHFTWQLGTDPTIGASEFCKYGLVPPSAGGACSGVGACSCTASGSHCDASTDQGIQATTPAGPCVSAYYQHECMEVELSVPNGGGGGSNPVNFVSQSSWNNLEFAQMSTDVHTAVVDVRGLLKPTGEKDQDVYLFVMPRNMPASVPAGTTGLSLITSNAMARAKAIAARYGTVKDDAAVDSMRSVLTSKDAAEVQALLQIAHATGSAADVTHQVVGAIGPVEAATVVPTLDIYAFYKSAPQEWAPMTSFAVFLSHEGGLTGIHYEIDGATKVAENIYHLHVPFDHAREIRIRSQATTAGESVEPPGNPKWPCRGGCCSHDKNCGIVADLGNTGPAMLVGMVFFRRRKKRAS
ncbi:MAG TPA: hypothetical protein VGG28_32895 [Kofleriaceae bacterium]|jgi:hypothetical protein